MKNKMKNKMKLAHKIARILTEGSLIDCRYKDNLRYVLAAFNNVDKYQHICRKLGYNPFVLKYLNRRKQNENKMKTTRKFINKITWLLPIMPHGWGNGYVAVHKSHPLFGIDYDGDDVHGIDIHGGLTYSDTLTENDIQSPNEWLDEVPTLDDISNWWVFGFDTAHTGDNKNKCTQNYVIEETKSLEEQLLKMGS